MFIFLVRQANPEDPNYVLAGIAYAALGAFCYYKKNNNLTLAMGVMGLFDVSAYVKSKQEEELEKKDKDKKKKDAVTANSSVPQNYPRDPLQFYSIRNHENQNNQQTYFQGGTPTPMTANNSVPIQSSTSAGFGMEQVDDEVIADYVPDNTATELASLAV
jgi:hypothetical protein